MKIELTKEEKSQLESWHRKERDGRVRDRIKVVLLKSENWTDKDISQALRIHPETVSQHVKDWEGEFGKLKPENGGSQSKLSRCQSEELDRHVQENTYTKVSEICSWVQDRFGVSYSCSGMTKWLRMNRFSYKKPKAIPAKADEQKQEEFIAKYIALVSDTPAEEPIVFVDAVHPTMATKITHGWIKVGVDKPIATTASRTRVNVIGGIELNEMKVTAHFVDTVNAQTNSEFLQLLKTAYPQAPKIHVVLDQAGYNRSQELKEQADLLKIELHFLPPYSPNLNPIERLWKIMNEKVRNNVVFESAKEFREEIIDFFKTKLPKMIDVLRSRINDNFQVLNPTSSS